MCKPTLSPMVVHHDAVPLVSLFHLLHGFLARSTEDAQGCGEVTEHFFSVQFHSPHCSVGVVNDAGRDCSMGRDRATVPCLGSKHAAFRGSITAGSQCGYWDATSVPRETRRCGNRGSMEMSSQHCSWRWAQGRGPRAVSWECGASVVVLSIRSFGEHCWGGGLLRPDVKRGLLSFCAESTHGASLLHVNPNCWVQNFTRSRSCYDVNQLCPAFGF